MYNPTGIVGKKTDSPENDQDNGNRIKNISHNELFLKWNNTDFRHSKVPVRSRYNHSVIMIKYYIILTDLVIRKMIH